MVCGGCRTVSEDLPQRRRAFFRESLARVVGPLADLLADQVDSPRERSVLRPPGAIEERTFVEKCFRSGHCLTACPADAIRWLHRPDDDADQTPYIDPDLAACVVCEGLKCTHECPSGALQPVDNPRFVRMGRARLRARLCVRSDGHDCSVCAERCPIGEVAIRIEGSGPPTIYDYGCVGCGLCRQVCPASPKAIVIDPG